MFSLALIPVPGVGMINVYTRIEKALKKILPITTLSSTLSYMPARPLTETCLLPAHDFMMI